MECDSEGKMMVNQKEKVLIVHNYYQIPGGEDTVVMNEKKMLEEHGHEVVLYTRSNSELKTMSKVRKMLLPVTTVFNLQTYKEIRKIICEQNIDIVHVHNTLNLISPAVYYAALSKKIPVVQTVHNFRLLCPGATFYRDGHICEDCVQYGLNCAIRHNCYRNSKLQTCACVITTWIHRALRIYGRINYICLTEFNKEKLLTLKQIHRERIYVKPNFVQSNLEYKSHEERKNQIVYLGRIDELKGIRILMDAWSQIEKENVEKKFSLIICGTGKMEIWCKNYIKENNLKNIEIKGFVSNEEALKIIGESKAVVLPTQVYEGFPMVIVEAISVGTPVIGSDIGNVGSIIQEGITGYKFDFMSSKDLVQVLMNADLNINDRVFSVYQKLYTKEDNYFQLLNCYREVSKHG